MCTALLFMIICVFIKIICVIFLLMCALTVGVRLYSEPISFSKMCKCKSKLYGKIALVTGGNSGIGFETAKDLAKRGARVIIASRNVRKSEEAVSILRKVSGNMDVEHRYLNLADLDNVREFAHNFNKEFSRLHILVNNAGCGNIKKGTTEYGIDKLMQINYVGPFLLTYLLLDKLIISKPSRIVTVSSMLHIIAYNIDSKVITKPRNKNLVSRYADTKMCIILWTKELAKRLPKGVTVNSVHPGIVMTKIFSKIIPPFKQFIYAMIYILFKTAEEGAQTIIHLCVSPELDNSTGGYYQNCKEVKPAKRTEDNGLSRRIWDKTIEILRDLLPTTKLTQLSGIEQHIM